jgi:manganese-dependent inorganic pyrophosphatase
MLAGILSDTLHFRSPTTTDEDQAIALKLQAMTNIVDLEEYAMDMFTAKSDLGDISTYDLIKTTDFKDFQFGSHKCGITCVETTNPEYCLNRKDEIIAQLNEIKAKE